MVKIALIELPVQFIRNLPRIKIEFDVAEDTSQHHGKLVNIVLRNRNHSSIDSWSYTHVLQDTNIIHLSGVAYGNYVLEVKPLDNNTIDLSYQVMCLSSEWSRDTISNENSNNIDVSVLDANSNDNSRFGGALMTSGSFTMMASNGM